MNRVDLLAGVFRGLSLRQLRWLAIILPLGFLATLYYLVVGPLHELFHAVGGFFLFLALLAAAVTLFSFTVFGIIERMQRTILDQNRRLAELHETAVRQATQLRALNEASTALSTERLLWSVLQRVVDLSRGLVQAKYAALAVLDAQGRVRELQISGLDEEARSRIGSLPQGKGLLGEVLKAKGPIRVQDVRQHPTAAGFPEGHPIMKSFLGTPIVYQGQVLGSLYLTDREGADEFSEEDAETVQMFAHQAAIAIENARLYEQLQALAVETERQRIAREMHDGLAQVLTYVNTKAQAVGEFLDRDDLDAAKVQVQQLATAARRLYADVREAILALRVEVSQERHFLEVLREYVREFTQQFGTPVELVVDATDHQLLNLTPLQEVQVLRILQEALTNVRKHAQASQVTLTIQPWDGTLEFCLSDNGRGFDPGHLERGEWPHFGLQTMRERAEAIGGRLEIQSQRGAGTQVRLVLGGLMASPQDRSA